MDKLEEIFLKQRSLTEKFHEIEMKNNMCDFSVIPFELTNPFAQKQLRSTAWYIIEEVGEVWRAPHTEKLEEMADVFHFLVELMICSGVGPGDICPNLYNNNDKLDRAFTLVGSRSGSEGFFVEALASALHCLKAKPWKNNPKLTNPKIYQAKLIGAFFGFINWVSMNGYSSQQLYDAYMAKEKVNEQRIEAKA